MMKHKIIPTIIAKNQNELNSLLNKYKKYFNYLQLDIMDGKFVKNKSNWFNFKLSKSYRYEAHLMVEDPEKWIKKNYSKFDAVIANFERVKNPLELIKFVKSKNKKIGFAINPETSIRKLWPYLKYLDRILILMVHPGKYNAKFMPKSLNKIKELRKTYANNIEVDGHMNPETIEQCRRVGANLFAVGSYLKDSKNLVVPIRLLNRALGIDSKL